MTIYRLQQVKAETGHKSSASIYQQIRAGIFTKPVNMGLRSVGWPSYEVEAIIKARIAGADNEKLKSLVNKLHQQRQQVED